MRKQAKMKRRTRCSYAKCNTDPFKKNLGYYYRGLYFCSKGHGRRAFKENEIKNNG